MPPTTVYYIYIFLSRILDLSSISNLLFLLHRIAYAHMIVYIIIDIITFSVDFFFFVLIRQSIKLQRGGVYIPIRTPLIIECRIFRRILREHTIVNNNTIIIMEPTRIL